MLMLEDIIPNEAREPISREEWILRLQWAYAMGRRDGTIDTLQGVTNLREDCAIQYEQAQKAAMKFMEQRGGNS